MSAIIIMALNAGLCFAQSGTIKHIVESGETLSSIARRYAVTEAEIVELNPDAGQFIYVGMELTIPDKQVQEQVSEQISGMTETSSAGIAGQIESGMTYQTASNGYSPSDFNFYGISYWACFDAIDEGYYMFGVETFTDKGWGLDAAFGFDYGLVDSNYAGGAILFGPAYGHVFNHVLICGSFDFLGEFTCPESKIKMKWGLGLMPKVIFMAGKVKPWFGIDALWRNKSHEIDFAFQIGIGFNL